MTSLARAAAGRPLFLVLDDLHWADEGTLLLLEHLAERIPRLAVMAVGTYRDTEVTPDHRLARPLETLLRHRLAHQLSLRRLPEDGVAALLGALSGQEPPPLLVAAVHAETQGNPFFTEEVFKHLAEEGRLYDEDGRFRSEVVIGELDVPESLRLVLGRRLERLGDDGRRALAAAAVVGRAFTYELLEALGELAADATPRRPGGSANAPGSSRRCPTLPMRTGCSSPMSSSARPSSPGSLRPAAGACTFSSPTRSSGSAPPPSTSMHRRSPTTLTQAGPAADRRRLLSFLALAGRQAMRTADYEDALRHFEEAVAMADWAEPGERADLFALRGRARRCLGRLEDALPDWDEALRRYEDLGNAEEAARMCLEASRDFFYLNRDLEALARAERGLTLLGDHETPQRAEMLGWTGMSGAWVSPFEPGAVLIDEAVALAERLGDKRAFGYGLVTKALHRFAYALHQESLEAGQEGIRLLRAQGDVWEVCTVLAMNEMAAMELGRTSLADEIGEELAPLASRLGHTFALEVAHDLVATGRHLLGTPDFDAFEVGVRRHLEVAGPLGFRHMSATGLAVLSFLRGDWDEALQWSEDAVRHSPEDHSTSGMDWAFYLRVLAYCGRTTEVHAVLDGRRAVLPRLGRPNGYGPWYLPAGAIEALWVIGDREKAAAFYPLVMEFMETTGTVLYWLGPALLERIAGIAATAGGLRDLAEEHFRTALRQAEELPFELEGAETRRFYAEMLLERAAPGDREHALSLVEQAIAFYRRISMPRHEELARRLLTI